MPASLSPEAQSAQGDRFSYEFCAFGIHRDGDVAGGRSRRHSRFAVVAHAGRHRHERNVIIHFQLVADIVEIAGRDDGGHRVDAVGVLVEIDRRRIGRVRHRGVEDESTFVESHGNSPERKTR